jgi:hypothetical protein
MDVRMPTDKQVAYLARVGLTQASHPDAFASREAASKAIEANEVALNMAPAREAQQAKLATIGINLGWAPKRLPGATARHLSLHLSVAEHLDAVERAGSAEQRQAALANMLVDLKRRVSAPVFKETRTLTYAKPEIPAEADKPVEPAPF